MSRPERVQAAFEVWEGKPELGPNATAMFEYIVNLEAEIARLVHLLEGEITRTPPSNPTQERRHDRQT